MSSSAKHGASISPSATAAAATTTTSSSSIDPVETTSSSSYFLPELIPLVASHLTTLQDFFALRATCRTYRALLPPSPSNLASQAPLLLVPDNASSSEALFHLPLRRILRFRLPRTPPPPSPEPQPPQEHRIRFLRCRVAIGGCDFVASHRELHVYHLLTGERARPPDPPHRYEGVIFSGDLVLTFNYCRIGDNQWQAARCDEGYRLINLISLKGTLYALVSPNERLAVVELDNSSVVQSFLEDKLSAEIAPYPSMFWLAECRSELLLIASQPRVPEYLVFRWQCRDRKWVRTTSLGDCSLFFNTVFFSLQVALVRIIRQFKATACTSLGAAGSALSILWLMDLRMNLLSTTQGEKRRIMHHLLGSFQAFADAVQWISELYISSQDVLSSWSAL